MSAPSRVLATIRRHLRRNHEWYWTPLVYAAAFTFIYRQVFFPEKGQMGFGWDTIESYWPDLSYFASRLRELEWPLWNPFEKGGNPYFAVPERGTYYPLNWLFGGTGAALGEVPWWLMQAKQFSHHLIAALCMHAFLRAKKLPPAAAFIGGLAWLACSPLLIHKASSVIWPMVWTPLIWLATDRVIERPNWRRGVGLGAAVALAGTAGSSPGFFYALLMALPYGIVQIAVDLWQRRRESDNPLAKTGKLAFAVGVAVVVCLGLLWVVVAPTGQLTELSNRAQRTVGYALSFPLPGKELTVAIFAPMAGRFDAFMGVSVVALALCGLAAAPLRHRGLPILCAVLAVFFLALSTGKGTPLLPWLVEHVPGFKLFRACNRYKLLAAPFIAVLAAYGASAIIEASRSWCRQRIALLLTLAGSVALIVTVVVLAEVVHTDKAFPGKWHGVVIVIATALALGSALFVPVRWAAVPVIAVCGIAVYEPQRVIHSLHLNLEPAMDNLEDQRWLDDLADTRVSWRIYDEFVLEQRAGSRLNVREFRGYPAGGSLEFRRYEDVVKLAARRPEILAAFNIRYILHGPHHRAGKRAHRIKKPPDKTAPDHFVKVRDHVFEARHPAPLVVWYGAVEFLPLPAATGSGANVRKPRSEPGRRGLERVLATLDADGVRRRVILEQDGFRALGPSAQVLAAKASSAPDPVSGVVSHYGANEITVEITAPAAGVVVVNEAHYPGWTVQVDGEPAEPFYANTLVRGVAVDAGKHTITWRFRPSGHGLRLAAFWLAFLFVILSAVPTRKWIKTESAAPH